MLNRLLDHSPKLCCSMLGLPRIVVLKKILEMLKIGFNRLSIADVDLCATRELRVRKSSSNES